MYNRFIETFKVFIKFNITKIIIRFKLYLQMNYNKPKLILWVVSNFVLYAFVWVILAPFSEKCVWFRQIIKTIIFILLKLILFSIFVKIFIFITKIAIYLVFCNVVYAQDNMHDFDNMEFVVNRIRSSWLYNSCEQTEDKILVINYFTQPHYRSAIIWYVACYYSRYRPTTTLSYFFPDYFPWPQLTEVELFDICLGTLDLGTVKEIVSTAENGIPGFSEYWRPPEGYYVNPVESKDWMHQGPVLPYWKLIFSLFISVAVFLLKRF